MLINVPLNYASAVPGILRRSGRRCSPKPEGQDLASNYEILIF